MTASKNSVIFVLNAMVQNYMIRLWKSLMLMRNIKRNDNYMIFECFVSILNVVAMQNFDDEEFYLHLA